MSASTLYEVARRAGVSLATASRVLNGSTRRPGDEISERVKQAAEELGYIANAQAQGLARKNSGMLGLILHDISDPYFSTIARGVQEAAREEGKVVLLASTGRTPQDEREAVATFAARRADAVVIAGSRTNSSADASANGQLLAELRRYGANGGKVVVIGQDIVGSTAEDGFNTVEIPNTGLSRRLAAALVQAGHRRFIAVGGPEGLATSDERLAGFQSGLADAGAPAALLRRAAFNRDGGYSAAAELAADGTLGAGEERACIFAANDVMAIGVVAALREHGLRVPEDVAVAGFDDIETLRDFSPALTTVALPLAELGQAAVARVLSGESPELPDPGPSILLRHSTD